MTSLLGNHLEEVTLIVYLYCSSSSCNNQKHQCIKTVNIGQINIAVNREYLPQRFQVIITDKSYCQAQVYKHTSFGSILLVKIYHW